MVFVGLLLLWRGAVCTAEKERRNVHPVGSSLWEGNDVVGSFSLLKSREVA